MDSHEGGAPPPNPEPLDPAAREEAELVQLLNDMDASGIVPASQAEVDAFAPTPPTAIEGPGGIRTNS